jgi:hypothetical protein
MLEKFPDKDWNFGTWGISSNSALTFEMLEKFPDKNWNFGIWGISSNSALTFEMLENFPDKPWDWKYISCNQSITLKIIETYINKIDFNFLSTNKFKYNKNM